MEEKGAKSKYAGEREREKKKKKKKRKKKPNKKKRMENGKGIRKNKMEKKRGEYEWPLAPPTQYPLAFARSPEKPLKK